MRSTFLGIDWPELPFDIEKHAIYVVRRGSEAHGLYIPPTDPMATDDRDVFAVVVPPMSYYIGLDRFDQAEAITGQWDCLVYDIKKFISLLQKQNPNMLSALWSRDEDVLYATGAGTAIRDARDKLISTTLFFVSCCGYADGQKSRMLHFNRQGYMGEKRQALAEKYGFDVKNAAHTVRLLHMGEEFLREPRRGLQVYRTTDRELLIEIKQGKWSRERVLEEIDRSFAACRAAMHNIDYSGQIDYKFLNELTENCIKSEFRRRMYDAVLV